MTEGGWRGSENIQICMTSLIDDPKVKKSEGKKNYFTKVRDLNPLISASAQMRYRRIVLKMSLETFARKGFRGSSRFFRDNKLLLKCDLLEILSSYCFNGTKQLIHVTFFSFHIQSSFCISVSIT